MRELKTRSFKLEKKNERKNKREKKKLASSIAASAAATAAACAPSSADATLPRSLSTLEATPNRSARSEGETAAPVPESWPPPRAARAATAACKVAEAISGVRMVAYFG